MNIPDTHTASLDTSMVKRLVLKDWHFLRRVILGYLVAGAVSLILIGAGSDAAFYAGSILLITILISVGIHLPMATVIEERKNQTLSFIMSLPVSAKEYTTAKILANLLILLIPWTAITLGSLAVLAFRPGMPGGLIPFAALVLTEILVASCVILAVALVSESQSWTIGAIVLGNLSLQAFMYIASSTPSIAATMKAPHAIWSPTAVSLLLAEFATIAVVLGLTFFFQNRKTDFV